jgi:polysaccharide pyruvyl transferase WcaK-like protein
MRVLIHNSDSPNNRGDRAILVGVIALVRDRWPDAEIVSLSQFAARDAEWYGIRFLPQSPYSVNPLHWARLAREARSSDIVLWGGGEILKDYTNRLGLVYWLLKIRMLRNANRALFGAFQGIGPTTSKLGRWLIARTVGLTRAFIVRDAESAEKLRSWGVTVPIIESVDPAVLGLPEPVTDETLGPDLAAMIDGAIGFGVRRWFHYSRGGWVPFRFRPGGGTTESPHLERYRAALADAADRLVEATDRGIVFLPMHVHPSEGDAQFSREVIARMTHADRAVVIDDDSYSSQELAGIMSRLSVLLASRLHSAILAATAGLPALVLYYVDKGRLFYEQLGLERLSSPIEAAAEPDAGETIAARMLALRADSRAVRKEVATSVAGMRARLAVDFATGLSYWENYDEELSRPSDSR